MVRYGTPAKPSKVTRKPRLGGGMAAGNKRKARPMAGSRLRTKMPKAAGLTKYR